MREEVLEEFGRFRRRHLWVRGRDLFLEAAFYLTVSAAAILLLYRLLFEVGAAEPGLSSPAMVLGLLAAAMALSAAFAAAVLVLRPTPPAEIAWRVDRAAGGEERFLSALELAAEPSGGAFEPALYADAARVARGAKPARVLPAVPVGYRWGIVLSAAVGALLFLTPPRTYDAPLADFSAAPLRGPAPLEVVFRDGSIGAIDEFHWDFGDGQTGRGERAAHVYEQPGRYVARLSITGPGGSSEKTCGVEVLPNDRAAADFEGEPLKGRGRLEVRFRNLSKNAKAFAWDFGDGGSSDEESPVHVYERPGLYGVKLRVTNDIGSDERVRDKYVKVAHPEEPLADFRATPREGPAPLAVNFEHLCSGAVTEWRWDFGDIRSTGGDARFEPNPSHVYRAPGHYTVVLRVKGPHGEDEAEKVKYIHVKDEDRGQGKGGGGGGVTQAPKKPPRSTGGAGDRPGQPFGPRTDRPKVTLDPVVVPPHAPGGDLVEKPKVFVGKLAGGGGEPREAPLGEVWPLSQRAAEEAIRREPVPPAMRDAVREYFRPLPK